MFDQKRVPWPAEKAELTLLHRRCISDEDDRIALERPKELEGSLSEGLVELLKVERELMRVLKVSQCGWEVAKDEACPAWPGRGKYGSGR